MASVDVRWRVKCCDVGEVVATLTSRQLASDCAGHQWNMLVTSSLAESCTDVSTDITGRSG